MQGAETGNALATIAQLRSFLQTRRCPEFRLTVFCHHGYLSAVPLQMGQAASVCGIGKLVIDALGIACEKRNLQPAQRPPVQNCVSRLNRIDRDLRSAEGPHPLQLSTHSPSGLDGGHTGTAANLFHQRFISGSALWASLGDSTPAHTQLNIFPQDFLPLAIRQPQIFIELRRPASSRGAVARFHFRIPSGVCPGCRPYTRRRQRRPCPT